MSHGSATYLFCWMGDRAQNTVAAILRTKGMKAENEGVAVVVLNVSPDHLRSCLHGLLKEGTPDAMELARSIANKACEKYDLFLTDELLSADYAASRLDVSGALLAIKNVLNSQTACEEIVPLALIDTPFPSSVGTVEG